MRLKDPLQGIKISSGHILMHGTFFVINLLFVNKTVPRELMER